MNEISSFFCENFKTFLLANVSHNTASLYWDCFTSFLREMYKQGKLNMSTDFLKPIPRMETNRNYLEMNEVQKLMEMECKSDVLKRACLFSVFTGLRFSDVQKMVWSEIQKNDNQFVLKYRQQKTKGFEILPLPEIALKLCGERQDDPSPIFEGLKNDSTQRFYLKLWIAHAGIKRNITFHCFRHTYATISLNNGIDLYTVSKMLGHKDIRTTQIYAKITDVSKRNAANKINDLFNM
jgi:integrase